MKTTSAATKYSPSNPAATHATASAISAPDAPFEEGGQGEIDHPAAADDRRQQ